ncbi:MAG TPA: hypothetical protein V6C97_03590 [Oculatellaceae cyanobacterium]
MHKQELSYQKSESNTSFTFFTSITCFTRFPLRRLTLLDTHAIFCVSLPSPNTNYRPPHCCNDVCVCVCVLRGLYCVCGR